MQLARVRLFVHGYNNPVDFVRGKNERIDAAMGTRRVLSTWFNWKSKGELFCYKGDQEAARFLVAYFNE